ncbi:hypothetical protein N7457_005314 [Penicillium paradoxum]|uniref:uncharacterized protein n=1 Tax=Penicillium paradoxum TaxID=176176 RepID=UPI00254735AA|nr:uncharacterized protein N7457_005314 [Penicillium paradoxum]KAJ5780154.1 hypothetical protein N7457_005314 [Penicillium paradoxum]
MPSNIQVFVKWKDQTIFAGEDVECTITFKNVADTSPDAHHGGEEGRHSRKVSRVANRTPNPNSETFFGFKSPQALFSGRRSFSISSQRKPYHRTASSLSSPLVGSHSFPPNSGTSTPRTWQPGHNHQRSVSILSIDSEGQADPAPSPRQYNRSLPARGHGRSASLQVLPRRQNSYEDSYKKARTPSHAFPFPLTEAPSEHPNGSLRVDTSNLGGSNRPGSLATSPVGPVEPLRPPSRRPQPPALDFKFPAAPPTESTNNQTVRTPSPKSATTNGTTSTGGRSTIKDAQGLTGPAHQQLTRIISATSVNASSRSSGEFYSVSDHSTETLGSEYTNYSVQGARTLPSMRHMRNHSSVAPPTSKALNSQALLMGYAQVSASFTVDGSLVNQAAFDEVKRKGVVGGQAGAGIPGRAPPAAERPRKTGGFWGALKWNTIEESINGLLSNNELDGLREMRGVTSSRSIPLLSTSQSLLFVDLRLAPGEEQSYSFSFSLPKGLPASHKGKAIKISYNLVIGTQRPSGPNEPQKVNRINIPFRVFSGVNEKGDVLGHDLMSPYVLLRDEAKVQKVGPVIPMIARKQSISKSNHSASDFLSYVDEILEQRARSNTLFPPGALPSRRPSVEGLPQMLSSKDIIDFAILRSNQAMNSRRSPNRFEIAREGQRIAEVVLNRPVHRLGETVIATMDFGNATIPCYAVRASLETSEKVSPTLAIRSHASIHRTTRRIHASLFENTLHATRVVFSPAIPVAATPSILTSGVTLDWELRFEFVTSSVRGDQGTPPSGTRLLETLSSDDRGQLLCAMEHLNCESFEISIPLTVYGETVRERLPEENQGYPI